jgi:hypothetical protein
MGLVSAASLDLTVAPSRQVFNVGEKVVINGNLTEGGSPISDAIVAVEVDNPVGDIFLLRTVNTGPLNPNQTWPVETLEVYPCDAGGSPKYDFQRGGNAGFKVKVKNNAGNPYDIIVILTLVYSNQAPYTTYLMYNGSIEGGKTKTILSSPAVTIPEDAVTGNTTVYANIYNVLPGENGFAYCPEESTWFLIGSGGGGQSTTTIGNGNFSLEISLSGRTVWLGNYTIYSTVKHGYSVDTSTSQFEVILIGDVTGPDGNPDGKVDMRDVAFVARYFGTEEDDPDWNPDADLTGSEPLVPDGTVDMRDIALVARAFGTITES